MENITLKKRQYKIMEQLHYRNSISVEELARDFDVTPTTIRRELTDMESKGLVERRRGFVKLASEQCTNGRTFSEKAKQSGGQKRLIARAAFEMITPYSTVILDSGSTTLQIAQILGHEKLEHVAIITNSYPIIPVISENYITMVLGGTIDNENLATIGPLATQSLDSMIADIVFLGATGINVERGLSIQSQLHADVKKMMIKKAIKKVAVLDSEKFEIKGGNFFCGIDEIDVLVTVRDERSAESLDWLEKHTNVQIICV